MADEETTALGRRIDALTAFLPHFEKRGAGRWEGGNRLADGRVAMPWFAYDETTMRFFDACQDGGWIEPFDWPAWQAEAKRYCPDTDLLRTAELDTLRHLLTLHIRKDRFAEGHFAAMVASGHIAALLRRLATIRTELQG